MKSLREIIDQLCSLCNAFFVVLSQISAIKSCYEVKSPRNIIDQLCSVCNAICIVLSQIAAIKSCYKVKSPPNSIDQFCSVCVSSRSQCHLSIRTIGELRGSPVKGKTHGLVIRRRR